MKTKEQDNIDVLKRKEEIAQKKYNLKIDKKHIQGFVAGIVVMLIILMGFNANQSSGLLMGTVIDGVALGKYHESMLQLLDSSDSQIQDNITSINELIEKAKAQQYLLLEDSSAIQTERLYEIRSQINNIQAESNMALRLTTKMENDLQAESQLEKIRAQYQQQLKEVEDLGSKYETIKNESDSLSEHLKNLTDLDKEHIDSVVQTLEKMTQAIRETTRSMYED